MELGQLWFRWWLVAWRCHATIWTSVDKETNSRVRTRLNKFCSKKITIKEEAFKMPGILFRPQYFSPLPSAAMPPLCEVRAIYILAMCISVSIFDFHWPPMLVVEPEMYLLGLFGPRALWGSWPVALNADQAPVPLTYFDRVRVSIGVWGALVWGVLGRSWGGFAHVATVTLSWRVRNFIVIGGVRLEPQRGRFGSGFEFGRGIVGGTGARAVKSAHVRQSSWPKYCFIFCFCFESILFACCIMSCHVGNKLYWNWKIELKIEWKIYCVESKFSIFVSCGNTFVWCQNWLDSTPGTILGMDSVNKRRRYMVSPSLIGWFHTQNDSRTLEWRHMRVWMSNYIGNSTVW